MNSTQNQRAIQNILTGDNFDAINHYGCWCDLTSYSRGKGKPVNFIDEVCKTLILGYECAIMDAEARGETCIPWEELYRENFETLYFFKTSVFLHFF